VSGAGAAGGAGAGAGAGGGPVLVLLAHPALQRSRVNRALAAAIWSLPGVTLHDLYEEYPEHDIDVEREKSLLISHSSIVFQHPFYWYSTPPILKEWQDLVLEYGWAYGSGGDALRGKTALVGISTGGRQEAYGPAGLNRFTIRQLLAPIEQTFHLCGMPMLPPFVVHGSHALRDEDIARAARDWRRAVEALRDGKLDAGAMQGRERLNEALSELADRAGEGSALAAGAAP
jgi:glutathione-regulated potassium-efflux system ancillary protein KefG